MYDVEDLATALIKMEDGSTLTLEVSWAVHMDTDNTPFVHLMGTEGGASYRGANGKLLTEKFDKPLEETPLYRNRRMTRTSASRFSRHFLACILARQAADYFGADRALRTISFWMRSTNRPGRAMK